jgi:hypothetical protein
MIRRCLSIGAAACMAGSAMAGSSGLLWDNGPLVTNPGAGFDAADVSAVSPGQNLLGGNFNLPSFSRADNFTVTGGGWNISSMMFFGYQTNGGIPSTITGLYARIWLDTDGDGIDGDDSVVWGDMTTNIMSFTGWTGIYRTSATAFDNTQRPIMNILADGLDVTLADGEYWVEFAATGSTTSGPWVPLVSSPDAAIIGNSLIYSVSAGTWSQAIDSGNSEGYELPFMINGTVVPAPAAIALLGLAGLAGSRRRR